MIMQWKQEVRKIVTRRLNLIPLMLDTKDTDSTGRFGERSLEGSVIKTSDQLGTDDSAVLQFDPLKFPERADSGLQPQAQAQIKPVRDFVGGDKADTYEYVDSRAESHQNMNEVTLSPSPVTTTSSGNETVQFDAAGNILHSLDAAGPIHHSMDESARQQKIRQREIFNLYN